MTSLLLGCAPVVKGNDFNTLAAWPKFKLGPGYDTRLTDEELRQVLDLNDAIECARDKSKCAKP